ncbi:carbohydrate ABC transporter permease [Streptomyces turgidiscabies]|uniref:Putative membrane protein n=1 Tax=Streptomyces turgidiscabies (strain Car8) TaxID=698760 RepID=L7FDC4_STRT8|nr:MULTISPECIES: sugar ABC transporter permease [Streptomyces]ELP68620.1 putative membrane protein [Streptomyces turgidiscabies Car8]MDX3494080.1 sugar ABC transporter permease [Streptomyces turgidiscabies]GAQ68549.1 maltose transport system permease protein MalF [Streptomyces turgidiscabies]
MTTHPATERSGRRRGRSARNPVGRAGYVFVSGYVLLLLAFGVLPTCYAVWLALSNSRNQLVGIGNFTRTFTDYRFGPAFLHIGLYLVVWLASLMILVVLLSLMLHGRMRRASTGLRFLFYLPGALAGVASVLLFLILLDPAASPVGWLLKSFGWNTLAQVNAPGHLPVLFTVIAFWTGAGGWIVVMYGALNSIPDEILEAARIDGAGTLQIALRIQIPMITKWIAYMLILAFAAGTQLFVEPQLVSLASWGMIPDSWSPNQLSYQYAFQAGDFNGAAALSVDLLVLGLACAALVVFRTGLFSKDEG